LSSLDYQVLLHLLVDAERWFVLTGAGCSTEAGIPDYRDERGQWKRPQPVQYREFMDESQARKRYWARSMVGWVPFGRAMPGPTHRHLAALESMGRVHHLITQNVDELHQRGGSQRVVDLHGKLSQVVCTDCRARSSRDQLQRRLESMNPQWAYDRARTAPDGDVDLDGADYANFEIPVCTSCAGTLKPDVVFFGESVPRPRVEFCFDRLGESDAVLVVGSSLMVFSGYRFVREAVKRGLPVAIINLGTTRADDDATVRVTAPSGRTLAALVNQMQG
jgi:NAD-dependent SIR2 family protein deacetylase